MLQRIKSLISKGQDFAFETTLSTKSYKNLVEDAKRNGYAVTLIFFYLSSQDLAVKRVETRVKEGGHNIPEKVIRRRYENGLNNFFNIFRPIVDEWLIIENSGEPYKLIAQKKQSDEKVYIDKIWNQLKSKYDGQ